MENNRIRLLRNEANLTLNDVSKALDIPYQTLRNYEINKRVPRDQETWKKMADFFDVPIAYLMGLTDMVEQEADIYNNGTHVKNDIKEGGNGVHISTVEIAKSAKKKNDKIKELELFLKNYLERTPTESEIYGVDSFLSLKSNELKDSIVKTIQNINLVDILQENTIQGLEKEIRNLKQKEDNNTN